MKEVAAAVVLFIFGVLFGLFALYSNLRINSLEAQHVAFVKDVETFAKQVNERFNPTPAKPAPAQVPAQVPAPAPQPKVEDKK